MPARLLRVPCLLLLPVALLWACASSSKATAPSGAGASAVSGQIMVSAADRSTTASLKGKDLTGPQLSVSIDSKDARGSVIGAPVSLSLKESLVSGTVGASQTRLKVQPEAGGLRAEGLFAGRPASLVLSDQVLQGEFVSCSYSLRRAGVPPGSAAGGSGELTYEGSRNCVGARVVPVSVTLPAGFTTLSPEQQATILNLVLGH